MGSLRESASMNIDTFITGLNARIHEDTRPREHEPKVSLRDVLAGLVAHANNPASSAVPWSTNQGAHDVDTSPAERESVTQLFDENPGQRDIPGFSIESLTHDDIIAERCRRSLSYFVRAGWHVTDPSTKLEWNWHHELICSVLQGVLKDWLRNKLDPTFAIRVQNVIVNIPPGSLKSRIVAIFLPAWMWLQCPSWSIICLSVNNDAVKRDARISRELICSPWYRNTFKPEWEIKDDQDAVTNYGNTAGGSRLSKPAGSEIVGLRADLLLLDDPNNPKESQNEKARDEVNTTWRDNTASRINSPLSSIRIIVQQNTHEDDLSHYVLRTEGVWDAKQEPGGMGWLRVVLPAEFELARKCITPFGSDPRIIEGQTLHEGRFTKAYLAKELKRLGPYGYAGQYQQRPAPLEGGMFKRSWWRFASIVTKPSWDPLSGCSVEKLDNTTWIVDPKIRVRARPDGCSREPAIMVPNLDWVAISVDASFGSTKEDASRVGLLAIGGHGPDRFVLADETKERTFLDTVKDIEALCKRFPSATRVLIENKANGPAIIETLKKTVSGIVAYEPKGSKKERAHAMVPAIYGGNVYLLDGADWLEALVGEFGVFPKGTADDRVDTLGQIIAHMASSGMLPDW